jgi:hypothetical protein
MYRSMAFFFTLLLGYVSAIPAPVAGSVPAPLVPPVAAAGGLGLAARQMIVCLAQKDSSFEGTLQLYDRDASGQWQPTGSPWPVLYAPRGLAWGRGLNPPQDGPQKVSDDHRNPAGLFKIGDVLGYAPHLPDGARGWPYHQVTDRDAWIDQPGLPGYNHLYTLPEGDSFPWWWNRERLHLDDYAYQWMVVIEHNYDPAAYRRGTSIFFHIRRGLHYRTAGCTTMAKDDLVRMIKWLQPGSNAMLAELSRDDYFRVWKDWGLPPPKILPKGYRPMFGFL